MTLSSICRSVVKFYFNCHHVESSSLYVHSAFTRRLQFACRLVSTFLICTFVGYGTTLSAYLSHQFMIPNSGVICIQETFGHTLSTALHVSLAIIPLSIILFIIQHLVVVYHNYPIGIVLILSSSFCISYMCKTFQTRKLTLLFNALFFLTIFNKEKVQSKLAFQLVANYIIGMFVAVLASMLIFPLFATFDIENRVNYCLLHIDQMHQFVLQAFLCEDEIKAQVSLARARVVERRLHKTMSQMRTRLLDEIHLEPSRLLQRICRRRKKTITHLNIKEQADLVISLMFHVCSLQSMTNQCLFNKYHKNLVEKLQSNFIEFTACQSKVISALISPSSVTREVFLHTLNNLQAALDSANSIYKQVRIDHIEEMIETGAKIQSEDHLSHAFFFFQLGAIVRILRQTIVNDSEIDTTKTMKQKKEFGDYFKFQLDWSRISSAIKSMIIIGVGSIFVMVPSLANTFANGQWILIGLCTTQGDTVGGALTSMKMRLIGILLGSMWSYAIYLAVGEVLYKICVMLVPWLFLFGYLKLVSHWDFLAPVAATTPILINLGQTYGNVLREGNYVLLRIEETIIGIGLGAILTILIFPTFAVDMLKKNIQDTLKTCCHAVESIHSVYDHLFQQQDSKQQSIDVDQHEETKFNIDPERNHFHRLITSQRTLVQSTALEPSFLWFNYGFSSSRYHTLALQQHDMFRILHSMHATLMYIKQYSLNDHKQIEDLRLNSTDARILLDLDVDLTDLSRQLNDCVNLWISYFTLTKTTYYRWSHIHILRKKSKLIKGDLSANEDCLIELHRTVLRLQTDYQQAMDRLTDYFIEKSAQKEEPSTCVPYAHDDQADSILVTVSAMYYSTIQLVQVVMALGTTIHTIFELETTNVYRNF
ncbi:unnamed protein product [Adineta steineri]|uniref:Integral membrane bound transporter domain-containing protein n=2 Tax=Adineta steineri TaxID=433720 RepID=A0A814IYY1_9BILA|nr:unnamed protein product [Adineta steineri]